MLVGEEVCVEARVGLDVEEVGGTQILRHPRAAPGE
jgi:hypothetical protein